MNLDTLLSLPRNVKKTFFVIHDIVMIFVAFWFAQSLKANYSNEWSHLSNWLAFASTAGLTISLFVRLGLYRAVTRYVSTRVLYTAVLGSAVSAVAFFISVLIFEQRLRLALPVVYFLLLVVLVTSSRIILRSVLSDHNKRPMAPVIIYGAGQSGRQLLEAIKQVNEYNAVAFVDDNPAIQRSVIYDIAVYRPSEIADLISRYGVEKILLAIPSATMEERKAIIENLKQYNCEVLTIPGMKDLVDGKIKVSSLKKISVVDLLGRDPVAPRPELMGADITGKVVMVTGAGGSIGSELCRQILKCRPAKLLLFELSEFSLYSIDKELRERLAEEGNSIEVLPFLGSVQNKERLLSVMKAFAVETVYHAAAYKHVPMVEFNTVEGIRNNVFGTLLCAQAAVEAGVGTFVLISTDKAVRPTNTMGASKRPEAAQLVIQAGAMGKGGDVFVLDMGESVKIIDLAKQMINLSGLRLKDENHPDGDIEIKITGLRPGEKLYEELLIGDEVQKTTHPRIMTASEVMLPWDKLHDILSRMESACRKMNQTELRALLLEAPAGFNPKDEICDLVWQQNKKAV